MPDLPDIGPEKLYNEAPCALLLTQPTGEILHANQTFFDWLRMPPEEVLGMRFQNLLTVGSRIYYETHYAPLLQMQGFVSEIALQMRRNDGQVCPVVAGAKQERDVNGVAVVNHVALFDSSDRRRYEKELLEARKRAEHVSRELEATDRRKNTFIAMLAHELRNPLGAIRSGVELVRRFSNADNILTTAGEKMQRQVAQMVRLVEDLLDVARVAQNKLTLRRTPVDLASVVQQAVETSELAVQTAGLQLAVHLPPVPVYAEADAARLIQVISNIVNNAVKFTPSGGAISIGLRRDGDHAVLEIRDTGIGIEAEKIAHVFDMFMQADPSSERRGGLGLGLTLAKSLVEQHGGRITVRSEGVGRGAEFSIHLPALAEAPDSVVPLRAPVRVVQTTSRRVLVVDDNRDSAYLLALLLEHHGHEVRQAHDGLEAVEAAEAFQPDVVLLDIGLPMLNGYEAAQRIRAQLGSTMVLVALTGWGQESDRRRSEAAGFNAHLVKPVDNDALVQLIAELPHRDTPIP